jgi:hypothetical protein
MKSLVIQIHPERYNDFDEDKIIPLLMGIRNNLDVVKNIDVDKGNDNGRYININFVTDELQILWRYIQNNYYSNSEYSKSLSVTSIVVCEGNDGWNDYLLLQHFNEKEKIDLL